MKKITLFSFILLAINSYSQKLFWTSYFGGDNSNGSIVEYDLISDQLSTKYSLDGNPLNGADVILNIDSWEHPGAFIKAQDGFYYGVSTLASIGTTNLEFLSNTTTNNSNGVLYRIDPANFDVKILHVFEGRNEYISGNPELVETDAYEDELSSPIFAPLEVSAGIFYGLCESGGTDGAGGIYKFEVSTGTYTILNSFDKTVHGKGIHSPLVKGDGDNLYGVLQTRNSTDNGFLYKINTTTNQLDFVKDLSDASAGVLWVINNPRGSLVYIQSLNSLVGVKDRFDVSSNWGGGCYAYNITTGDVENRFTINWGDLSVLGSMPVGITRGNNGKYYIVTMAGGANNNGTIIEYDFQNNVPIKVHDFPAVSSVTSYVSGEGMQVIGSKVYGFYQLDGSNANKAMWSYDYVASSFNSFLTSDENSFGTGIQTSFVYDNGKFIGKTLFGGLGDVGTLFEYDPNNDAVTIKKNSQSPNGRNLVGDVYIHDNTLWSIANKGGENSTDYTEGGGYLKLDLVNGQADFTQGKITQEINNMQQVFQCSAVDTINQKLYQIIDLHTHSFHKKKFELHDLQTGNNISLKTLSGSAFLTNPILDGNKVYFAYADSIEVFNTTNGQFEASSYIGDPSSYGWARGSLTKASNGLFYGHTANFLEPQAKSSIFSYDTSNGTTTIVAEFDTDNRDLNNAFIEYNNKLYGTSNYGGTNSNGYIFSMDLTTNQVDTIYNFNGVDDGRIFEGSFTFYNNMLYAVSYSGGQNGNGTLVRFDPSNNTLTTLEHLTVENGRAFKSTPALWDDAWLGINEEALNDVDFIIYPNPTDRFLYLENGNIENVLVYSIEGRQEKVEFTESLIDLEGLAPGVYIISIEVPEGQFQKRVVIQ